MARRGARVVLGCAVAALACVLATAGARADPITIHGLTFSDEQGGFRLLGAWGSGTLDDPITLVEVVTRSQGVVLVVRGFGPQTGNSIPTAHPAGFVLRKIVTNATHQAWTFYDIELQKTEGTPSDIFDGLSFGQDTQAGRPFTSNRFQRSVAQDEPADAISFFDGIVKRGQSVSMTFVITATGQVPVFYILQRPNGPIASLGPGPSGG